MAIYIVVFVLQFLTTFKITFLEFQGTQFFGKHEGPNGEFACAKI